MLLTLTSCLVLHHRFVASCMHVYDTMKYDAGVSGALI